MSSGPRAVPTYSSTAAAPSNYVAGLGRGAVGFTTRSDIGPARDQPAPDMPQFGMQPTQMLQQAQQQPGGPAPSGAAKPKKPGEPDESQYDEEYGYGGTLFGDTPYEEDDAEADRIYEAIDERMDERRKRRREEQLLENMKKYRQERPKIQDQFADLKRELGLGAYDLVHIRRSDATRACNTDRDRMLHLLGKRRFASGTVLYCSDETSDELTKEEIKALMRASDKAQEVLNRVREQGLTPEEWIRELKEVWRSC